MRALPTRVESFLFGQEAALQRLTATRVSLGLAILLMVTLGPFDRFFGQMGPWLYAPRGLLAFIPVLGSAAYMALRVSVAVSAAAVVTGLAPRASAAVLALTFLVLNGYTARFTGSAWNYDTHLNFFVLALLLARRGSRQSASFVLAFMQLYVALVYFQAGVAKLLGPGLTWFWSGVTPYYFTITSGTALGQYLTQWPSLFQVFTAFSGLLELSFPALMLWPRTRRLVVLLAMGFHIGTYLVMGISFWHLWMLYPALFLYRPRAAAAAELRQAPGSSAPPSPG